MSVMRLAVVSSLLVACAALAQPADDPPPTPEPVPDAATAAPLPPPPPPPTATAAPPPPAPTPPPESAPSLGDRLTQKKRFSRFSAGAGGPLFAFSEFLAGAVAGGFIGGATLANTGSALSGIYVGSVVGALGFGSLGIAIQYSHPMGLGSAATSVLGTVVGGLAGLGFADIIRGDTSAFAWSLLIGSQVGALATLMATWSIDDVDTEDVTLMGMSALHVFVVSSLLAAASGSVPAWPLLISPAVGMGLGALWAMGVDMPAGRVLKLTLLPVGVGLVLFYLGGALLAAQPNGFQLVALTTLAGYAATFGLT